MRVWCEKNYHKAIKLFRLALLASESDYQKTFPLKNLGTCYFCGYGVKKDYLQAAQYFQKSADLGCAPAQLWLGNCYYYGNGVPQDYQRAFHWYSEAAKQNNADALFKLGLMYEHGKISISLPDTALEYYKKAAALDHQDAKDAVERIETKYPFLKNINSTDNN